MYRVVKVLCWMVTRYTHMRSCPLYIWNYEMLPTPFVSKWNGTYAVSNLGSWGNFHSLNPHSFMMTFTKFDL